MGKSLPSEPIELTEVEVGSSVALGISSSRSIYLFSSICEPCVEFGVNDSFLSFDNLCFHILSAGEAH